MPDIDSVISKVQKLLRLSQSDNANEAAAAAKAAQDLIAKYEIDQAMLDDDDESPGEKVADSRDSDSPLDYDSPYNLEKWRERLVMAICDVNHCKVYYTSNVRSKQLHIVGRPSDTEKVRYLFQYFKAEVNRLAKRDSKGYGKVWLNNYRHGVVDTLEIALHDAIRDAANEARKTNSEEKVNNALIRLSDKNKDVEKFFKDMNLQKGKTWQMRNFDLNARDQGRLAGEEIRLTNAKAAIE